MAIVYDPKTQAIVTSPDYWVNENFDQYVDDRLAKMKAGQIALRFPTELVQTDEERKAELQNELEEGEPGGVEPGGAEVEDEEPGRASPEQSETSGQKSNEIPTQIPSTPSTPNDGFWASNSTKWTARVRVFFGWYSTSGVASNSLPSA